AVGRDLVHLVEVEHLESGLVKVEAFLAGVPGDGLDLLGNLSWQRLKHGSLSVSGQLSVVSGSLHLARKSVAQPTTGNGPMTLLLFAGGEERLNTVVDIVLSVDAGGNHRLLV